MRILVTGAGGFMGSSLVSIAKKDHQVFGFSSKTQVRFGYHHINLDINNYSLLKSYIQDINPDVIYHFAANPLVSSVDNMIESNVILTDKICRASVGRHIVFSSSVSVYGSSTKTFTTNDKIDPESIYAVTKVQCEELLKFYSKSHLSCNCIRFVTNVGRNSTHGVLPDIVRKIKENPNSITVYGEKPGSIKPYLHVLDAMKATLNLEKKKGFNLINMSPKDAISVDSIVDIASHTMGVGRIYKIWDKNAVWSGDQRMFHVECDIKFPSSKNAIERAVKELI